MENKYFILICVVLLILGITVYFFSLHKVATDARTETINSGQTRYMPLGDSYTIGQTLAEKDRFPNLLTDALKNKGYDIQLLENPSLIGFTTEDLIRFEIPVLATSDANLISILIGVNDQFQDGTPEDFQKNFRTVVETVINTKPNAKIFIITIPDYGLTPQGEISGDPKVIAQELDEFNTIIKNIAQEKDIPVVDIWDISKQVTDGSSLLSNDGLHPSKEQYQLWTERMLPTVESLLQE